MKFEINTVTKTIEFEGQIDLLDFNQMITKIIGDDKGWIVKSKIQTITVKEYVQPYVPYVPYVQPWNPWKVGPIYLGSPSTGGAPYLNPPSTTTVAGTTTRPLTIQGNSGIVTNTVQGLGNGIVSNCFSSSFQA